MENQNGWSEWSRHVLAELKRLSDKQDSIESKIDLMALDLATTKAKSTLLGALSGGVTFFLAWAFNYIRH